MNRNALAIPCFLTLLLISGSAFGQPPDSRSPEARTDAPVTVQLRPDGTWRLTAQAQVRTAGGDPATILPNGRWETATSSDLDKALKTMADMRIIATAIEAYSVDNNHYPKASTLDALAKLVAPTYIRTMPRVDTWGRPYSYSTWGKEQNYRIISGGADAAIDAASLAMADEAAPQSTSSFTEDIVFMNGQFVRYPEASAPKP